MNKTAMHRSNTVSKLQRIVAILALVNLVAAAHFVRQKAMEGERRLLKRHKAMQLSDREIVTVETIRVRDGWLEKALEVVATAVWIYIAWCVLNIDGVRRTLNDPSDNGETNDSLATLNTLQDSKIAVTSPEIDGVAAKSETNAEVVYSEQDWFTAVAMNRIDDTAKMYAANPNFLNAKNAGGHTALVIAQFHQYKNLEVLLKNSFKLPNEDN